jgi:hypothetical protein
VRLIGVKHFQVFHDRWFLIPPVEKNRQMLINSGMLLAKWVGHACTWLPSGWDMHDARGCQRHQ